MARRLGLGGGFGARYGRFPRRQYVGIVSGLRTRHECPRCRFRTVKRWSVGVWLCKKCGYKFAGGAYIPVTKLGEIAARATRGTMSPSTLSTELDSLRAGARVAPSIITTAKRTRTRRKKVAEATEKKVEAEEPHGETPTARSEPPSEDGSADSNN